MCPPTEEHGLQTSLIDALKYSMDCMFLNKVSALYFIRLHKTSSSCSHSAVIKDCSTTANKTQETMHESKKTFDRPNMAIACYMHWGPNPKNENTFRSYISQ